LAASTSDISQPQSYAITWSSDLDFTVHEMAVLARLTPSDGKTTNPQPVVSGFFSVLNGSNTPPTLENLTVDGNGDDILLTFGVRDPDGDKLRMVLEYSTDRGQTWSVSSNLTGSTLGLSTTTSTTVAWNSTADLPGVDQEDIQLRLSAHDDRLGEPIKDLSPVFTVYNENSAPSVTNFNFTKPPLDLLTNDVVSLQFGVQDHFCVAHHAQG